MASRPPSRTPGRKIAAHAPPKSSRPPVTPVASRAPSASRPLPSTSKSLNPRTPSRASTQSRMTTPRSSRPTTPCPNRDAHKLPTPERKPPVPRVTLRKEVEVTHTVGGAKVAVPRSSPSAPSTPRKAAARLTTPRATPSRRAARADENALPSSRGVTGNSDTASTATGRQLLRTPLRQKQAENNSPAKPVFRF
ncbi:hypothetical protein FOMPIDRAFT_1044111 [Fomitopsis schrenkii]|uniref:Uncharacterized protein n=1 Tax=Fomitopsis schrenkii TaxID=2126942 RepID=S8EVS7_FOMSC|nr:hypothetical protein FOMPIDRAFT_1044111 [Fomitopsis schrenkii]